MKMHKIAPTVILIVLLVLSTATTALAAPNDDVIQALKNAKIPETYIIQAENYLKTHELTQEEANAVIAQVDRAAEIMEEEGTKDVTKLSVEAKQEILQLVAEAGKAIDVKVTVKKQADGEFTISGTDVEGREIAIFTTNEVKQTGIDHTTALAGAAMIIAAAVLFFVVKKNIGSTEAA